jgi:hypothetical protein
MPYKSRKSCLFIAFCLEILSFVRKTALISGLVPAFGVPVRKTVPISGLETVFGVLVRKTAPISGLVPAFGVPVRKSAPISGRSVRGSARGAEGGAVPKFFYEVFTVVENVVIKFLTCFVTL